MEIIRKIYSDTLMLEGLNNLLGKRVKINIEVIDDINSSKNDFQLGRYKLGTDLDQANIRDLAYEEN